LTYFLKEYYMSFCYFIIRRIKVLFWIYGDKKILIFYIFNFYPLHLSVRLIR